MVGLTGRQAQCLAVIKQSIATRGYPPTLRELGNAMGIKSTNGVNDHLRALERKKFIHREDLRSRAIVLLDGARAEPDPAAATLGQFLPLKRCAACGAHTFADACPYCPRRRKKGAAA